jgi:NitT/TauT family transport system ATP-binding protein
MDSNGFCGTDTAQRLVNALMIADKSDNGDQSTGLMNIDGSETADIVNSAVTIPTEPLVVSLEAVTVSYRFGAAKKEVVPIKDISLEVHRGEFVAILGPSGCGKTTILRVAAGLLMPTSGRVLINYKTPDLARKEGKIGYVFQDPVLLPWRTVRQNVELPREIMQKAYRSNVEELLRLVRLEKFADALPSQLSGGMRSRTSIARALYSEPSVLLMDEPFANLDALTRDSMQDELQRIISNTETSVLFVTHSIEEAILLADRINILGDPGMPLRSVIGVPFNRPRLQNLKHSQEFQEMVRACRHFLQEVRHV